MQKYIRLFGFGFLSWLVPFVASIFFYTKEGTLLVDVFLFKSIMIVVGSLSASVLFVLYFKHLSSRFLKESVMLGITWFGINLLLDIVILLPMAKLNFADYFAQIGMRYLVIPVFAFTIGMLLETKQSSR